MEVDEIEKEIKEKELLHQKRIGAKETLVSLLNSYENSLREEKSKSETYKNAINLVIKASEICKKSTQNILLEKIQNGLRLIKNEKNLKVRFIENNTRSGTGIDMEIKDSKDWCDIECGRGDAIQDIIDILVRLLILEWNPHIRAPIIFDQPGKNLSETNMERFCEILKQYANIRQVPVVMISHSPAAIKSSNKVYLVKRIDGISSVSEKL